MIFSCHCVICKGTHGIIKLMMHVGYTSYSLQAESVNSITLMQINVSYYFLGYICLNNLLRGSSGPTLSPTCSNKRDFFGTLSNI